jgi:shikimate kinase
MGVGKTTVGALLAVELGVPFFDSDGVLAKRTGEDGAAIAGRDGVAALHDLELELFLELAQSPTRSVIAAAASVVDHETGRRALAENTTVWLTATGSVLTVRLAGDDHRRETSAEERTALEHLREPLLRDVSSFEVDTASKSPDEVVAELVATLSDAGLD